jgi:hypothetical protein
MPGPYNGTATGSPIYVAGATNFGQAISLSGSGQWVTMPLASTPVTTANGTSFALSARIKIPAGFTQPGLIACIAGSTDFFLSIFGTAGTSGIPFVGVNGGAQKAIGTVAINDGAWHYLYALATSSAGQMTVQLYVDGTLAGSAGPFTFATVNPVNATIGVFDSTTGNYPFAGLVDERSFYSTPPATPTSAPASPTSNSATGLVSLYHLDGDVTDSFGSTAGATSYTLAGPTTGVVSAASTNFTITPNATYTGTITPNDASGGGTFTPASLTWPGDASVKAFTYTPSSTPATRTIGATSSPALTSSSGTIAYVATSAPVPTLTITSPVAFAPVGITGSPLLGSVVVSGTYTGTAPAAIEWNWSVAGTTYAVGVATPTANAFTFTAAGLVPGNGALTVRFVGGTGAASVASLSVGDNILAIGQSNQVGQGTSPSIYQSGFGIGSSYVDYAYVPHAMVDPIGSTAGATDTVAWNNLAGGNSSGGSVWPIVAGMISDYTGRPCNVIMAAQDGAGLLYDATGSGRTWLNTDGTLPAATGTATLFAASINRGKRYGPVAAVDYQGCESDGIPGTITANQVTTGLGVLGGGYTANLPGSPPMVVNKLSDCPSISGTQATIRAGIGGAWTAGTVKRGADLKGILSDDAAFHYKTAPKLFTAADRKARAIIAAINLAGDGSGAGGSTPGTTGIIPVFADVRLGTAVGSGTGTLAVPSASQVVAGVAVDATVGTYAGGTALTQAHFDTVVAAGFNLAPTGLDLIATTPAASGTIPNFRQMMVANWRRWFRKHVASGSTLTGYADDGTTVLTSQATPTVVTDQTQGAA